MARPRLALIVAALLSSTQVFADGQLLVGGNVERENRSGTEVGAPGALLTQLTTFGARFDAILSPRGSGAFRLSALDLDLPAGDLRLFSPEAMLGTGGGRFRFALLKSDVMFFCTDEGGGLRAPFFGTFDAYCSPNESLGAGIELADLQWGPERRFAARWASLSGVLAFLGNGQGAGYFHHRLNVVLGASVETSGLRALTGVKGFLRSHDARWEGKASALYRPAVEDYALEANIGVARNFRLSKGWAGSLGLDLSATYWSEPELSIGLTPASGSRASVMTGLSFSLKYDFLGGE